ncbi:MAG: hypothetical protein KGL39_21260 [Patescibacteria group bacterium]|nr:hypothetical protein [Patescibacteria group bacterium]
MNVGALADAVTKRIGMIGPRDVAFCKTSLTFWHDRLYRARLWKDSLVEYLLPIDPGAAYAVGAAFLPTQGVIVCPPIIQQVVAVRTSEHCLSVQRPMVFYRVDQDSFVQTGTPLDFLLMSTVAAAFDTVQLVQANLGANDYQTTLRVGVLDQDGTTEDLSDIVPGGALTNLGITEAVLRLTKPATQAPVVVTAGANPVILFSLAATATTAPQRQRVRLADIPDTATTVRILAKRTPPTFAGDQDEPGVSGFEGILRELAYYDMLCRDERGGTAEATNALALAVGPRFVTDGTSGGMLRALEQEEVAQAACNTRIMPDAGFGPDEYYVGPLF